MHEPRYKAALGVGYAMAPVGADHMMNIHDTAFTSAGAGVCIASTRSTRSARCPTRS